MASLLTVFNHLVLPPKVPGQADPDSASIGNSIGSLLLHACDTLISLAGHSEEAWVSIRRCLHACLRVNQGRLEKAALELEFRNLQPGETLILHIVEQNAALLVRRNVSSDGMDTVIFESFEASASSEAVLHAEDALRWDFPGRAAEIPLSVFVNEAFRENLAMLLEQASMESIERFRARSIKAESDIGETRDTANPALITQMLLPLLEAVGSSINVPRLRKKVRDEVNIQNAGLPWRRLPFWLILRVATQLHLYGRFGSEIGRAYYKVLICTVLAELLKNAAGDLSPELTLLLRAKLCRRLAKIEMDKAQVSTTIVIYEQLLASLTPLFQGIIKDATAQVQMAWDRYKRAIKRPIPRLPYRASEDALHLSLPNSTSYIDHVLSLRAMQQPRPAPLLVLPSGDAAVGKFRKFADHHFAIAELEQRVRLDKSSVSGAVGSHQDGCTKMANSIERLFDVVENTYEADPQEMSLYILTLFELWIQMDESAVKACRLLAYYRPVFQPDLLDVLQLPKLSDMERLQSIQTYLHDRSKSSRFRSIFSEPGEYCFAAEYANRSSAFRKLHHKIASASNSARQSKEDEWQELSEEYDRLSQKISDGTCVCTTKVDGTRSVSGCKKCWHWRCRKRLNITIHEDFLPKDQVQAEAVVFELCIPGYLAAYRNATWKIVSCLAHPGRRTSRPPVVLLKDHSTIEHYAQSSMEGITLASTTKSFGLTHFKALRMRVDISKCLFPLGLRLSYYDTVSGTWLKDLDQPLTFHHICGVHVPRGLQTSVIPVQQHPSSDSDALSSYETMANQNKCPSDMSFREFMCHQRLRSGYNRRWLLLLVELGASNLNFSSEDTMLVLTQLAMQAGPNQSQNNVLRDAHSIFRDRSFCDQLLNQIGLRIRNISSNWREGYCMDILITLTLRLHSLGCLAVRQSAMQLLKLARMATSSWIHHLRNEVRNASGADAARRASIYALWAALLCRKTFTIAAESKSVMDPENLSLFVQASLALQENLTVDPEMLPQSLKSFLARDLKMAYSMRSLVIRSIRSSPDILGSTIDKTWSETGDLINRIFSPWQLLTFPPETWVASIVTTTLDNTSFEQSVHYNLCEGRLLVNGKPLGRLPSSIADDENVKELFGNQHLLTYPSSLNDMSHVLTTPIRGHWIHFGHRSGHVVIRAITKNGILEFIPRSIFVANHHDSPDLPHSLTQDCVHWLDINAKIIEIRRKPAIWRSRASDWILDFANRRAKRKNVSLIDPNSALCRSIAGIFSHFEDPRRITVFQPAKGSLSAEMRVLELSFFVNRSGLLVCRELRAAVDPNQDAGTFYGLESKIVLRDVHNPGKRNIITAMGPLTWKRNGMHVSVRAANVGQYGKFQIDDVLGRVSCPPEPLLMYTKAVFHAFTSFPIPDPLTGRSGGQEAMHVLRSGSSQPWSPLSGGAISKLRQLQELAPTREYYPKDKRRLQTVNWNEDLTVNVQHDSYEHLVEDLLTKSNRLQAFDPASKNDTDIESKSLSHLSRRGEIRRFLYEHWSLDWGSRPIPKKAIVYQPRDRMVDLPQATKLYRVVNLCLRRPFSVPPTRNLADILQDWEFIGGFHDTSELVPSSLVSVNESSISERWGQCVKFCRDAQSLYDLVFLLALMAFAPKPDMNIVNILAAFGSIDELKALPTPTSSSYTALEENASPNADNLLNSISTAYVDFIPTSRKMKQNHKAREKHLMLCEAEGNRLVSFIVQQRPFLEISLEGFESPVIDVEKALEAIAPEVERLRRNRELSEYAVKVQEILDNHRGAKDVSLPKYSNVQKPDFSPLHRGPVIPSSLPAGLRDRGLDVPMVHVPDFGRQSINTNLRQTRSYFESFMERASAVANHVFQQVSNQGPGAEMHELGQILDFYTSCPDLLRQEYGKDLKKSLAALESVTQQANPQRVPPALDEVQAQISEARITLDNHVNCIREVLSAGDERFGWLRLANLWPCFTLVTLLELLRSTVDQDMGKTLKESLVACGLLVTTLQRLRRIEDAVVKGAHARLQDEMRNQGHENWSASEFPDWLLLEIDSNFLIRPEQIEVAHAIISPASGRNSVLQMNMGQGKTSSIVPMAMAILGNKKKLARLIVPKALLLQTAQTIQSRLGGLAGREIRHVAYFRHTPTTPVMRRLYADLHKEVLNCCGVILTTPEHVLSYKLSGLQLLADSKLEEARDMIHVQSWLDENCRDVLDESDFTLAVKTQLIYPSGSQMTVDGGSYRWRVAQGVLSLVEDHLTQLQRYFPRGVEVVKRPKGFPMMYFPQKEAEDALQRWIIKDVCSGKTDFLRLANPDDSINKIEMQRLLLEDVLDQRLFNSMTRMFADPDQASKSILILRGLLMNRILLLCLKKRWNVQYGLHPRRDPVAVPFEAKGVPSELAEFGHPDVAIMFTCLAFYYSGLTIAQFRESLNSILNSDDPAPLYDTWISGSETLPEALRYWNVINMDDQGQLEELWQHLRFSRHVLDHYMNNFVFPRHAKQFTLKIQASGWDLPLFTTSRSQTATYCARTTGFSGTNDNKMMLPLTIKQDDLDTLQQTNAEVLGYLLQARNRVYNLAAWQGRRLTEEGLLHRINQFGIRVFIDAGAYVLEMDNQSLVKTWLDIDVQAKGAVYFGADNRAWLQYRGSKQSVPLIATPFAENLDECLVYLDEAHTRGIDLKLPQFARGALTLALGQTKDHTVQAAMRLRQLGSTQSVVFFAPPEVHQSILDCNGGQKITVNSSHVVRWLLEQTCSANEQLHNLYLAQGTDFCRRTNSRHENPEFLTDQYQREAFLNVIQPPERQALEQLYGSVKSSKTSFLKDTSSEEMKTFMEELDRQRQSAKDSGNAMIHSSTLEEVEQERLVEFQVEEVRVVQKPKHFKALSFPGLHPAISKFAEGGILIGDKGYIQAFEAISRTCIGEEHNIHPTSSLFFVSGEFLRTIQSGKQTKDDFFRPVEWILWAPSTQTGLVLIPEEAEVLIPLLGEDSLVHLIPYAAPVTKYMLHFNQLSYYALPSLPAGYTIPDWFLIELGIFAGRLYIDFQEYCVLTDYLQNANKPGALDVFTHNPISFLLDWLNLRCKGQDISQTPMGYICQGRSLKEDHPFFLAHHANTNIVIPSVTGRRGSNEENETEDDDSDIEDHGHLDTELGI